MTPPADAALRDQLRDRRLRLERTIERVGEAPDLLRLLRDVDSALGRVEAGSFGQCELCQEPVENGWLREHPTTTYCLCDLSPAQQRALEHDLGLAARVQGALLPPQDLTLHGWEIHHRYLPLGPAGGDYCDVFAPDNGRRELVFLFGDVSGKGLAASLVMARLNALFRTLVDHDLPVNQLVERANRLLLENPVSSHYATLVCGRALIDGRVELCIAGHEPPLLIRNTGVEPLAGGGPPVGLLADRGYVTCHTRLEDGESLFLRTDGLDESRNADDEDYGGARLARLLEANRSLPPDALAARCLEDLRSFQAGSPRTDDLTLMVLRHCGG